jgi:hypothetical protein
MVTDVSATLDLDRVVHMGRPPRSGGGASSVASSTGGRPGLLCPLQQAGHVARLRASSVSMPSIASSSHRIIDTPPADGATRSRRLLLVDRAGKQAVRAPCHESWRYGAPAHLSLGSTRPSSMRNSIGQGLYHRMGPWTLLARLRSCPGPDSMKAIVPCWIVVRGETCPEQVELGVAVRPTLTSGRWSRSAPTFPRTARRWDVTPPRSRGSPSHRNRYPLTVRGLILTTLCGMACAEPIYAAASFAQVLLPRNLAWTACWRRISTADI